MEDASDMPAAEEDAYAAATLALSTDLAGAARPPPTVAPPSMSLSAPVGMRLALLGAGAAATWHFALPSWPSTPTSSAIPFATTMLALTAVMHFVLSRMRMGMLVAPRTETLVRFALLTVHLVSALSVIAALAEAAGALWTIGVIESAMIAWAYLFALGVFAVGSLWFNQRATREIIRGIDHAPLEGKDTLHVRFAMVHGVQLTIAAIGTIAVGLPDILGLHDGTSTPTGWILVLQGVAVASMVGMLASGMRERAPVLSRLFAAGSALGLVGAGAVLVAALRFMPSDSLFAAFEIGVGLSLCASGLFVVRLLAHPDVMGAREIFVDIWRWARRARRAATGARSEPVRASEVASSD